MSAVTDPNLPEVARQELRLFLRMAEQTGMDADGARRSLRLSQDDWQRWLGILHNAPMPARPALPLMLRHLGYVTNRLDRASRERPRQH
jgi:hypothetical protein